jgi:hypothetical protein
MPSYPSTQAQAVALQLERVRAKVALLYPREHTFADVIQRIENDIVSSRAMRIPVQVFPGSQNAQTTFAGSDLGVGTASTYEVETTTPIGFVQATSWSLDSMWATDSNEQAVESFTKRELKNALQEFAAFQSVVQEQDSTGTIDTVLGFSSAPNIIFVNNPSRFRGNEVYNVFSAIGGTNRGPITILSVDQLGGALYLSSGLPAGLTDGDLLLINGAPGTAAGTSINGLAYANQDVGNTGSYLGLSRASYPGVFRTPHIAANGQALTSEMGRAIVQKRRLVNGAESEGDFVWYCGLDQEQAIEALSVQEQSVILNQVGGNKSVDPIKHDAPSSFVGRKLHVSATAVPGRLDGIDVSHWLKSSMIPGSVGGDPVPLSIGGNTEFQMYGTSGGLAAAVLTYLVTFYQLASDSPRSGCYIDGLPVPAFLPLGSVNA